MVGIGGGGLQAFPKSRNALTTVLLFTPGDLAWTLDPEPFGIPLYSYYKYLRVSPKP